jgi:predicted nucleic acid-binding protein
MTSATGLLDTSAVLLRGRTVDAAAARAYARVAQAMSAWGRKVRARGFDALIAAVALANGLTVHTANPDDSAGTPGLEVVDIRPGLGNPSD